MVLDEPDVFLHPYLQRRLVRLLASLPAQTITATHSSEVLAEAPPESVVWIDKSRKRSISGPTPSALAGLSDAMGTGFSIRLARALRAKCALFVEGDDAQILRRIASTTGAARVATETGIVVIPLRGFDNWEHVEPFSWMTDALLDSSVQIFVLLDRDYRTEQECAEIRERLHAANVKCHVWKRKELESYLLEAEPIARLAGADVAFVEELLASSAEESEDHVFSQVMVGALRRLPQGPAGAGGGRRAGYVRRPLERPFHTKVDRTAGESLERIEPTALRRRLSASLVRVYREQDRGDRGAARDGELPRPRRRGPRRRQCPSGRSVTLPSGNHLSGRTALNSGNPTPAASKATVRLSAKLRAVGFWLRT